MKLGVMANVFGDKSWEDAAKAAKSFGMEAIEPGVGGFVDKTHCNPEKLLKDKDAMKRWMDAYKSQGLVVSALAAHGNPIHPDPQFSGKHKGDLGINLGQKGLWKEWREHLIHVLPVCKLNKHAFWIPAVLVTVAVLVAPRDFSRHTLTTNVPSGTLCKR